MKEYISALSIDRLTSYEILSPSKVDTDIIGAYPLEFIDKPSITEGKSKSILEDTKNDLYRRFGQVSASDIVAALTFGFWGISVEIKCKLKQFQIKK